MKVGLLLQWEGLSEGEASAALRTSRGGYGVPAGRHAPAQRSMRHMVGTRLQAARRGAPCGMGPRCILHRSKHPDVPADCAPWTRVPVVSKPGGRSRRPLLRQGLGRSTKSRGLQCQLAPQPCRSTEMACNGPQEVLHCMLADFGNSCYNAAWPETLSPRATPSRKQNSLEIPCCDPL